MWLTCEISTCAMSFALYKLHRHVWQDSKEAFEGQPMSEIFVKFAKTEQV